MANFAELNENNIVTNVLYVNNSDCLDSNGVEQEQIGISYLKNIFGQDKKYVQTFFSGSSRKMLAGIGYIYNVEHDKFHQPRTFNSWILNSNFDWQPPVARPDDGNMYNWNEETLSWDLWVNINEGPSEEFVNS
jgi:hypothetical protein